MADKQPLTRYDQDARTQALARFKLLQPYLEQGVPLTQVARHHAIPLRTLRSWVARYRQDGLTGLMRKPRGDQGQRRMPADLAQCIEGLALQTPPRSVASIHRTVADIARRNGWDAPSYATVYAIVRQLDPGLVTLAHEGTKAYQDTYDLIYRREASRPNEVWQADHSLLDIWLLTERGMPARPWLTIIIDDYSRAVAGYMLTFRAPSAIQTALALHQAIWPKTDRHWQICGIPGTFYTDHGSDFESHHMEQVSAELKIQLVFSFPGRPQGRGKIERFFETVNQLFLCEQPGYTPPGTSPAAATLTAAQLEERLHTFIVSVYNQRHHSEISSAPQTRWTANGFLPHLPESREQLDLLLLTVAKSRRVQQDGIHFQGYRYSDIVLAAYVGEAVTIRYDPRDIAEIRVYHQNSFICRAICQDLADQTLSLAEIVRARRERRKQLRTHLSDRQAAVDRLLDHHPICPPLSESDPTEEAPVLDPPVKLKRYYNE